MKYQDKKVLVVGFGLEGHFLVDYFLEKGAKVSVADKKQFRELTNYQAYENRVDWKLGNNYLEGLGKFDLIAYSPGLKPEALKTIKSAKVAITTQMQIFFEASPTPNIIGISGTKGKGTTSTLIYQVLKEAGKTVYLAGNIGIGVLSLLRNLAPKDWVVLELSSYQLRDLKVGPHIGIILNITPDHLDIHPNFDDYVESKANLFRFQAKSDFALINSEYQITKDLAKKTKAQVVYFSKQDFIKSGLKLKIPGEHNFENAAAVLKVAEILNIDLKIVRKVFESFKGLPHRLEEVTTINGVKFIDDSFATSTGPTVVAIKAFNEPKILILGGSGKIEDFLPVAEEVKKAGSVKSVLAIGKSASKIATSLKSVGFSEVVTGFDNVEQVVLKAMAIAQPGDIVLLSPSDASFDWFKNYTDRGEKFKEAVRSMKPEGNLR